MPLVIWAVRFVGQRLLIWCLAGVFESVARHPQTRALALKFLKRR